MHILFLAINNHSKTSGVTQKIMDQALALGRFSKSLTLVLVDAFSGTFKYKYNNKTNSLEISEQIPALQSSNYRLKRYAAYCYCAKNIPIIIEKIFQEESFSSVYFRRTVAIPQITGMFRHLKTKYDFVLAYEIPTYPYIVETLKNGRLIDGVFDLIFSKKMHALVDHFFLITDSKNEKNIPFKKWTRISNGINTDRISLRTTLPSFDTELHLLGLANVAFWHGYDRVIKGLSNYYKRPGNKHTVVFNIAGEGPAITTLKQMTKQFQVEKWVRFLGPVFDDELDKLFERIHIGVASLGMHRKRLTETSELKMREFCARGIPFITSAKDPDFKEDLDFIFFLPPDDSAIKIDDILDYAQSILRNGNVTSRKMRKYAESYLGWEKSMAKVYSVFELLLEKRENMHSCPK